VVKPVIINASPLIFLSRSQQLGLLKEFADEVWVPQPVADEILRRGRDDLTAQAIQYVSWFIIKPVASIPSAIAKWRLGAGESGVLALALQHTGMEAIIDDLRARKCAASLGIPVRGTLGIVLVAKKRGLIPEAYPL
jgi:predicted nucleic acid-binding protein